LPGLRPQRRPGPATSPPAQRPPGRGPPSESARPGRGGSMTRSTAPPRPGPDRGSNPAAGRAGASQAAAAARRARRPNREVGFSALERGMPRSVRAARACIQTAGALLEHTDRRTPHPLPTAQRLASAALPRRTCCTVCCVAMLPRVKTGIGERARPSQPDQRAGRALRGGGQARDGMGWGWV